MEKKKKRKNLPNEEIDSVSNLFSILSNPIRVKILFLLKKKKSISVHELQELLNISQSNVSQQLSILRSNKLLIEERKGKEVFYSLKESRKLSKVLVSAIHLVGYHVTANSELLSTYTELMSYWA